MDSIAPIVGTLTKDKRIFCRLRGKKLLVEDTAIDTATLLMILKFAFSVFQLLMLLFVVVVVIVVVVVLASFILMILKDKNSSGDISTIIARM